MNENAKLILSGLGGALLVVAGVLGLDKADVIEPTPQTGDAVFDARVFCDHPDTVVRDTTVPGVSEQTYELERVKDGKQELVTWNGLTLGGTHWYWTDGVQQSEPATVDEDAQACIRAKAQ